MPRYSNRIDDNQKELVDFMRKAGAYVKHVHMIKGFVDVVVCFRGKTYLVEIKDGSKFPYYFEELSDEEKEEFLESQLTPKEVQARQLIKKTNVKHHIVYDRYSVTKMLFNGT